MKNIFKYFGILLSVAMMGAVTACNIEEIDETADVGLGIKVFFPTKVVAGQPMTINGSGFADVREVVFPDGVKVTDFEIVGNDMIRVTAPSGIAAAGGNLIVRTADEEAVSRLPLTLGQTVVSGYSKQDGESIQGGEQLTIFGKDLEFISSVELLDPDGNPLVLQDEDFYRKGTSTIIINIPKKVFDGTFVGKVYTFDGKEFALPELAYEPASDGGHWEKVKTVIWKNPDPEGNGPANWNGTYRFGLDGRDGNNECIATFPQDVWDMIKGGTFYMLAQGSDWVQMRITTGWWSTTWTGNDIMTGDERIIDNGDGTYYIEINFGDDPIVGSLDEQHLLFTGSGFTPLELYFEEEIWVDGGDDTPKEVVMWEGDGSAGGVNWNGTYRFGLDGHDGNNECIATFPQDVWDRIKTGTFYMQYRPDGDSYQIRVTTGWWSVQWMGSDNDIAPWNMADRIIDNGDGTFHIEVKFDGDPIVDALDDQHLLFTGSGYTPLKLYYLE